VDFQLHLETETVEQAYLAKPVCAAASDTVRGVLHALREAATGAAMVCQDGRLVGIFTERDALRHLAEAADLDAPVSSFMARNPVTLHPQDSIAQAISLMSTGGFRRLPIVDDGGKLVGLLKVSGVLRYLVEHFPKVIYTLPPTPHHKATDRDGG
jgi:CBS domain-containing protein